MRLPPRGVGHYTVKATRDRPYNPGMKMLTIVACVLALARLSFGDDSERVLTIDHYVRVKSTVPAIAGQDVPIYVRERVQAGAALRTVGNDRVALFVHGAGTP